MIDRREQLLVELAQQRAWIESCGGTLEGYIRRYGDPGVPPLDQDGDPCLIIGDFSDALQEQLVKVPGYSYMFFLPHFGNGGTAIWQADTNKLRQLELELQYLNPPVISTEEKQ